MDLLGATLGILLPWACGCLTLMLAARWRALPASAGLLLGYGFALGVVLLVLDMQLLWALGITFSVWAVATPLGLLLVALVLGSRHRALVRPALAAAVPGWRALSTWGKVLWWSLLILMVMRGAQFFLEILWRPSFGWDSWAHWATKAKVWHALGSIVPFGSADEVLAGTARYTDANPHYPVGIPLIQVWMALCVGSWDDTLINLPWLAFGVALGLGFYGQLRAAGAGPLFALGASYLLLSLPFLGVHIALPGYADLPLAVFAGLASMSFWRWSVERRIEHLLLALLLALASPLLKRPGWIWLLLLAPAALPILFGKRGWRIFSGLGGAAAVALFFLAQYQPRLLGYQLHAAFQPVWRPLLETTLLLNNWHLMWYAALLALIIGWRSLLAPRLAALTAYLCGGFAFLFVVFFFSNAALWVSDLSTVNRALLHLVPTLVFALALVALDLREKMTRAASAAVAPAADPSDA